MERTCRALTELQRYLESLSQADARAAAEDIADRLRRRSSRKHFPGRRRMGEGEAASHWHWVLFHQGDPGHLLRDHPPLFLAAGLLAAQYGLPEWQILWALDFERSPRRGPRPATWHPPPTCRVCHRSRPAATVLIPLCRACAGTRPRSTP